VRFDGGERRPLVLRRLTGTDEWYGTITWPTSARRARLSVVSPDDGRRLTVSGEIDAGRASLRATEETLVRDVAKARKRFKEAQFRADGADHVKSVVIP
jgi:hypothetical protein